jgi:membrane fusion protein (multidrug efflux system)
MSSLAPAASPLAIQLGAPSVLRDVTTELEARGSAREQSREQSKERGEPRPLSRERTAERRELEAPRTDKPRVAEASPSTGGQKRVRIAIAALVLALAGTGYWAMTRGFESTDNAQVDADLIAVPARVAGVVTRVHFQENQRVNAGDLLAELDDTPARAQLARERANLTAAKAAQAAAIAEATLSEANAIGGRDVAAANLQVSSAGARASSDEIHEGEAQVVSAKTRLAQAETDLTRAEQLFKVGAGTRTQLDQTQTARDLAESALSAQSARLSSLHASQAQSQSRVVEASAKLRQSSQVATLVEQAHARRDAAEAQVKLAQAAVDIATIDLSYTKIVAPHAGVVSRKGINEGQAIGLGQAIVQLVPDARWVTANFKETQLTHMAKGQRATFEVDAYPGVALTGEVESISGATGSRFALLPPDNATGNFTKVVQRVPVRVRVAGVPAGVTLRPGMSVSLKVDTREAH